MKHATQHRAVVVSVAEAQSYCERAAFRIVSNLRESNRAHAERTGYPSSVSDADYAACEAQIASKLMQHYHRANTSGRTLTA